VAGHALAAGGGAPVSFLADVGSWLVDGDHWQGDEGIPTLAVHHLQVSVAALAAAAVVGLPLGLWLGHRRAGGAVVLNLANAGRALPTYALLVLAVQGTGIANPTGFGWTGSFPTWWPLVLLGLPPILTGTYVAMRQVDPDMVDAARGMGMREREVVRRVELPAALPLVMSGVRAAMVGIVATATLASFTGFGTLATPINVGLATQDRVQVFAGAVCVGLLAVLVDAVLAGVQRLVVSPGLRER
jgi:osmoprotectant transport system permease protein